MGSLLTGQCNRSAKFGEGQAQVLCVKRGSCVHVGVLVYVELDKFVGKYVS